MQFLDRGTSFIGILKKNHLYDFRVIRYIFNDKGKGYTFICGKGDTNL